MRWRPLLLASGMMTLPLFANTGTSSLHVVTGIVADWHAGHFISVVNDQTNPGGMRLVLRDTVYDGDRTAIARGVRVTVWYRSVGERRPVAAKVRVPSAP